MKRFLQGKRKWFFLAAIAVIAFVAWKRKGAQSAASASGQYSLRVLRGQFEVKVQAVGSVGPDNRVPIIPTFSSRLEEVLVAEGDRVKKGQVLAWMSSIERASLLDAAHARGATAAALSVVEESYRLAPLISPISGTVISRLAEPGQPVGTGAAVFVISDRLVIRAYVDETDLLGLREGQKAVYVLDALPEKKYPARVMHVSYEAQKVNLVTASEVKLLPLDAPRELRPGMNAMVEILIRTKKDALSIPKAALKYSTGKPTVGLAGEAGKTISRAVELGLVSKNSVEVLAGLKEGDTVLVSSQTAKEDGEITMSISAH